MKAIWSAGVIALLLAGPSTAGAAKRVTVSDETLDKRIEQRMKADASLKKYDVDVSVKNHVVTLTGNVATRAQRMHAARVANISGVSRVDNKIEVNSAAAKGTTGRLGDKAKTDAREVKDKTKDAVSKTGEVINDGWITTHIKARFIGEDLFKDSDIHVKTDDHVVTLSGRVMTSAGRSRAVDLAKTTEGVHRVVDKLEVGPKS
jgi:osmotically-inducible protein OsmY